MLRLVTGGSGSGKSAYAEDWIVSMGIEKKYYLATMYPWDEECKKRIQKHRFMRAEKGFQTIEQYRNIEEAPIETGAAVLLECLSNLTANEFFAQERQEVNGSVWKEKVEERLVAGIRNLEQKASELIVVTNEIFSGGSDYPQETMDYLEVLGKVNVRLAQMAGGVTEVVYGIPLYSPIYL